MLDVHPPHAAVHGWRDFLLHILTITIGLFIALSLESAVDAMHHRRLVAEAHANIHREIEDNLQQLQRDLDSIQTDNARLQQDLVVISDLRGHPRGPHSKPHFDIYWSSLQDAAWRTARDTGALNYMPYDEIQYLSVLYSQQEFLNSLGMALFTAHGIASQDIVAEGSVDNLRPAEIDDLLRTTSTLSAQASRLQELLKHFQGPLTNAENLPR
jgi:hypothetical protein